MHFLCQPRAPQEGQNRALLPGMGDGKLLEAPRPSQLLWLWTDTATGTFAAVAGLASILTQIISARFGSSQTSWTAAQRP